MVPPLCGRKRCWTATPDAEEEARSQDGLPTIACDYTYMTANGEEDERAKPILVIKDSKTWSVAATFVDQKVRQRMQ